MTVNNFLNGEQRTSQNWLFFMSDFARHKKRTEYKNSVHQECELKTQEWKMQCYADEDRTLLPTWALTEKEVRKSSFTLPDKTATSGSAKIFQTTNHFRNLVSTLTSSENQPLVFLRNTHLSCNRMSQTASRSFIPGIWPTQKPRKEAQRADIFLIKGKAQWANTLDKVYPEHWTKGPKIAMGFSSTVCLNELYRLVKETSAPTFLSLISQLPSFKLCIRLVSKSILVTTMG